MAVKVFENVTIEDIINDGDIKLTLGQGNNWDPDGVNKCFVGDEIGLLRTKNGLVVSVEGKSLSRFLRYFLYVREVSAARERSMPYGGFRHYNALRKYEEKHNCTVYKFSGCFNDSTRQQILEKIKFFCLPIHTKKFGGLVYLAVDRRMSVDENDLFKELDEHYNFRQIIDFYDECVLKEQDYY